MLNFCANNYLGLSLAPAVLAAAQRALDAHGFGLSSVRFICGTQDLHKELERTIARFFGTDDAILYSSCFDANGGLFETLLGEEDAIISDALNHASIIDGIRLCKAERHRYPNGDMAALEDALRKTQDKRLRMIATDGVFSMDGYLAKLDTHLRPRRQVPGDGDGRRLATRPASSARRAAARPRTAACSTAIDVITSTLGKALGGAAGGFTTGRSEIVDLLRQRSRPYLFSNTRGARDRRRVASPSSSSSTATSALRERLLDEHAPLPRGDDAPRASPSSRASTPSCPSCSGDAKLAADVAAAMLDEGIYVIGFSYPVVPKGEARIRVQLSAAHEPEHVDRAVAAFIEVGKRFGVDPLARRVRHGHGPCGAQRPFGGGGVVCDGRSRRHFSTPGPSVVCWSAGSAGWPSTFTSRRSEAMPPPSCAGRKLIQTNIARPLMFSKGTPAPSPPRQKRESWLLLRLSPITHTSSGATFQGPLCRPQMPLRQT